MRILFLSKGDPETHDSWSGVSRSVVTHLRGLGHEVVPGDVELYGPSRFAVAARTFAWPRKRWWVRYHLSRAGFAARTRRASRVIGAAGSGVDVMLQVGATFETAAHGVPVALYCDSTITLSRRGSGGGQSEAAYLSDAEFEDIRRREEKVYRQASLIFCMSRLLRDTFIEDFGVEPERLVTIHSAPNTDIPDPVERDPADRSPPTVLFVGRDWNRKGGEVLVQAFEQVRVQVPDARLLVVGIGPQRPLPDWFECIGLQSRDTDGGRARMDRAYREATVFCLPTRFEPFGTSFVEAMAYQLPCVGPRAWAVPEIIEHERTGLLFEPGDTADLAAALVSVLTDRERAVRMGKEGRRKALAEFTWPGIASRMSEALESVADAKGASPEVGIG